MKSVAWLFLALCMLYSVSQAFGYHYIGCYVDKGSRDLPVLAGRGSMSASKCNSMCTSRNYKYFGVQYANECWCGNSYGLYGSRSSGECNMRCSGQRSAFCGAGWRNSVYASDYAPGLRFIGCFIDKGTRDLPMLAGVSRAMNIRACHGLCKSRRFAFFGVQNGNECWCGNGFGKFGIRPNPECHHRCSGDRHAFCGAGWRNSVYATGLTPLIVPSSHGSHSTLRSQLAARIKSQYSSFPGGVLCYGCLITQWIKQEVDVKSKVFSVKDMHSVLASYPAKVRNKVKVLQFGANAKTQFEDFHINIRGNKAVRDSYIGMAKRVNGNIELGMVAVELVGQLVQKYNVYHKKRCWKVLWVFTKCKTDVIHNRRGYHGSEVNKIDSAMRSETFRLFGEKLGKVTV